MITVPLNEGALTLSEGSGECFAPGCSKKGGGMMLVKIDLPANQDPDHVTLTLCGDCLMGMPWKMDGLAQRIKEFFEQIDEMADDE